MAIKQLFVVLTPKGQSNPKWVLAFTFSSILNLKISQTVRNWCLRFGGHVGIQVSSKILRLDVLKKTPSLQNPPCILNRGCFD